MRTPTVSRPFFSTALLVLGGFATRAIATITGKPPQPVNLEHAAFGLSKFVTVTGNPRFSKISSLACLENGDSCGEDDFLITGPAESPMFVVADGVGGWNSQGINPKLFTHELLLCIQKCHTQAPQKSLRELVQSGFDLLLRSAVSIKNGSCTITVARYDAGSCLLETFLFGDSGYCIVREGRMIFRSTEQQKYFNAPYQIGVVNGVPGDPISWGKSDKHSLLPGDVVVMGTDGVFDNLADRDIVGTIASLSDAKGDPKRLASLVAKEIAIASKRVGEDPNAISPFSKHAMASGHYYVGGKNDDTTVIAIVATPAAQQREGLDL